MYKSYDVLKQSHSVCLFSGMTFQSPKFSYYFQQQKVVNIHQLIKA